MATEDELFDGEFLKKLEYLHIVSKRAFAGQFRAERRAKKRGSGLEFADHRAYSPGDDFRRVDWRAYQRLEKLLLRLFEEEQDLPIYLFIDCSRSMADGRPTKLAYACQIAAALCYIGLAHLDRVTLAPYTDHLGRELSSQRGKGQIFKVFKFLGQLASGGTTDAKAAFEKFCRGKRPRGISVVISDFLDPRGFETGLNLLRFSHHDIFAIHVVSQADSEPELSGDLQLVDVETGSTHDIAATPSLLSAYQHVYAEFCSEVEGFCAKYQLGYVRTQTEVPFEDVILQVFRQNRFLT
ncbi:MAG: DUF58 domain-containing protein [Acidobacteria bacterium]|nr:DUF58 domain-containing protein [Acidobacteriota bacterium]